MTDRAQDPDRPEAVEPPLVSPSGIRRDHPPFLLAVLADARIAAAYRGEEPGRRSRRGTILLAVRLAWASDGFAAQVLYRAKARLQALRVPILPRMAHRAAVALAQVSIGDPVVMRPGVFIVHGQVVIDGITEISSGAVIAPFVTIGLRASEWRGPVVGARAHIGTGARVLGPIMIGEGARVGANAVALDDVPAHATAVGAPARTVPTR